MHLARCIAPLTTMGAERDILFGILTSWKLRDAVFSSVVVHRDTAVSRPTGVTPSTQPDLQRVIAVRSQPLLPTRRPCLGRLG